MIDRHAIAPYSEWAFQRFQPVFRPNTLMDISAALETKIAAMQVYETEARAFSHPRSPEALWTMARRWGSVVGLEAAEVFELIRTLR
jgi:LmbE family N-acetylglucosaminyl deacetylase